MALGIPLVSQEIQVIPEDDDCRERHPSTRSGATGDADGIDWARVEAEAATYTRLVGLDVAPAHAGRRPFSAAQKQLLMIAKALRPRTHGC